MALDDFAILIGVTKYPDLTHLNGPENDVDDIEDWLLTQGEVPKTQIVRECTSKHHPPDPQGPGDAHPGTDDLQNPFLDLLNKARIAGAPLGRRLYLYFSGHGIANGRDAVGLLPANARKNLSFSAIPGLVYANWLSIRSVFSEIVVFMDCCRDFVPLSGNLGEPPWNFPPTGSSASVVYGLAAGFNKKSVEMEVTLPDGKTVTRGIFTLALGKALREAPGDALGRVTIQDLSNYVHNFMPKEFGDEYPRPNFGPLEGPNPLVLVSRPATLVNVTLNVPNVPDQTIVDISVSPAPPMCQVVINSGGGTVGLKAGLYKATIRNSNRHQIFEAIGGSTNVSIA
jgi:hypothetical protein